MYVARDMPTFVMYCVNAESRSSVLLESTEYIYIIIFIYIGRALHSSTVSVGIAKARSN